LTDKNFTPQAITERKGIPYPSVRKQSTEDGIPDGKRIDKLPEKPMDAVKPTAGRKDKTAVGTALHFLKWENEIIGTIDSANTVHFTQPEYNEVVALYTNGADSWTSDQFTEFLTERSVNRNRRDIERILFRCGLAHYDVMRIAEITRGIHPKDLLWISKDEGEEFAKVITAVFDSIFHRRIDLTGDSIDSPEGYNIKRYGVFNGQYGIYKQRISPLTTDVESEVAVYLLAQKLGVPCCPAYQVDKDTVFSVFLYDFSKEYLVHFRRLFTGSRSGNEYNNLITVRPQYRDSIVRMIILDFITRQDDRHLSNIAFKINKTESESFYPLYDNGRSLFYEDTEETVLEAVADPKTYATTFGYSGTYWDYVRQIAEEGNDIRGLLNLDISKAEVAAILNEAGFTGYRFTGALGWIMKTLDMVLNLP